MNKTLNKQEVMSMLDKSIDSQSLNIGFETTNSLISGCGYGDNDGTITGTVCDQTTGGANISAWDYWQNYYHPYIYPSYPVYIQERAKDSSKQAFEIVKMLNDKKKLNIKTVKDFIDIMDILIKIL